MNTIPKLVTFDGEPPEGTINLGLGQPSADLLPVELVARAANTYFRDAQPADLNYGVLAGDARFLDSLAGFLTAGYGAYTSPEELLVIAGASQGLDLASMVLSKPGDTVFVEEPSFFLAFQIFRDHDLNLVGIPTDDDGICVDELQEALLSHKPAFLYTIPSYHNPGGQCTSEERRRAIVELAAEHDFLILADEVYQLLNYHGQPPPAYGTMIASNRVVSIGSFSKILAPGMRLGWLQTSTGLRDKLLSAGYINSGGSLNHISSHLVREAIDNGSLDEHMNELRRAYQSRLEAMDDALHRHFDGIAEWFRPEGGYFCWLRFEPAVNTSSLRDVARELETGFQPGAVFSSKQQLNNYIRLSFAHYNEHDIAEGIARLRLVFEHNR